MTNYSHFTQVERKELSALLKKGYSQSFCAKALKRNPSSVSREIKDNSVKGGYDPAKAQTKAEVKRTESKYRGMKIRSTPGMEDHIIERLKRAWTPEQIANRLKYESKDKPQITHKVIYQWLYSVYGQPYCQYLPSRRYTRRKHGPSKHDHESIKDRIFIDQRPEAVNLRKEFGHAEGDTLGAPQSSQERITAIQERLSRKLFACKVPRLKYAMDGFKNLLNPYSEIFLSWTLDNGVENTRYKKANLATYFCHAYASWEKGSLENSLGRLRRFIPKKARMESFTQEQIDQFLALMNNTPRKCLNWQTPNEVFNEQLLKLKH